MPEESATETLLPTARVDRGRLAGKSERALIREAARGSADAAEQLARAHWDAAHRAAFLITRDAAAAEDIAQESLLAALAALGRFDLRRSFQPWLHRIVANRAIDWVRTRERRREVQLDPEPEHRADPGAVGGVLDRLAELDPQTRAIVVLRCLFDYRPREIASMVGLSNAAVRTRLHRALADLRHAIEEDPDD
jgi:RNA polymerase sigma factor (sigma-70 family)